MFAEVGDMGLVVLAITEGDVQIFMPSMVSAIPAEGVLLCILFNARTLYLSDATLPVGLVGNGEPAGLCELEIAGRVPGFQGGVAEFSILTVV